MDETELNLWILVDELFWARHRWAVRRAEECKEGVWLSWWQWN